MLVPASVPIPIPLYLCDNLTTQLMTSPSLLSALHFGFALYYVYFVFVRYLYCNCHDGLYSLYCAPLRGCT